MGNFFFVMVVLVFGCFVLVLYENIITDFVVVVTVIVIVVVLYNNVVVVLLQFLFACFV